MHIGHGNMDEEYKMGDAVLGRTTKEKDIDRNMFFKLKEDSRTRGHKASLVKEQCRLDIRKYSFSQRVTHEWNKLSNDCVNASSVCLKTEMTVFKHDKGGLYIDYKIV